MTLAIEPTSPLKALGQILPFVGGIGTYKHPSRGGIIVESVCRKTADGRELTVTVTDRTSRPSWLHGICLAAIPTEDALHPVIAMRTISGNAATFHFRNVKAPFRVTTVTQEATQGELWDLLTTKHYPGAFLHEGGYTDAYQGRYLTATYTQEADYEGNLAGILLTVKPHGSIPQAWLEGWSLTIHQKGSVSRAGGTITNGVTLLPHTFNPRQTWRIEVKLGTSEVTLPT